MDTKLFALIFATIFFAELGDKTQLATLLFAARDGANLTTVLVAASLALVTATVIAVLAGAMLAKYIDSKFLSLIAGTGFILVGAWTVWQATTP